jgi:hypothetical protein
MARSRERHRAGADAVRGLRLLLESGGQGLQALEDRNKDTRETKGSSKTKKAQASARIRDQRAGDT